MSWHQIPGKSTPSSPFLSFLPSLPSSRFLSLPPLLSLSPPFFCILYSLARYGLLFSESPTAPCAIIPNGQGGPPSMCALAVLGLINDDDDDDNNIVIESLLAIVWLEEPVKLIQVLQSGLKVSGVPKSSSAVCSSPPPLIMQNTFIYIDFNQS